MEMAREDRFPQGLFVWPPTKGGWSPLPVSLSGHHSAGSFLRSHSLYFSAHAARLVCCPARLPVGREASGCQTMDANKPRGQKFFGQEWTDAIKCLDCQPPARPGGTQPGIQMSSHRPADNRILYSAFVIRTPFLSGSCLCPGVCGCIGAKRSGPC